MGFRRLRELADRGSHGADLGDRNLNRLALLWACLLRRRRRLIVPRHFLVVEASKWPPELREAHAKARRGAEHVLGFNRAFNTLGKENPYGVAVEFETDAGCHVARIRVSQERLDETSTILGDILHNFRSALDVIAWQLACKRSVARAKRSRHRIAFPLTTSPAQFIEHSAIPFFPAETQAVLERLQPYPGRDQNRFLKFLGDMSNADKHRLLHPALAQIELQGLKFYDTGDPCRDLSVEWCIRHGDVFEDKTKIALIDTGIAEPESVEIDVAGEPATRIAFGDVGLGPNAAAEFIDVINLVLCEVAPLFE